jgi:CHAT domain-containing protein
VISTLWDIDDEAAALLMEEMYCRLLDGAAVADALRAAQLHMLKQERFAGPEYWAAFTLTGDPQGRFHQH